MLNVCFVSAWLTWCSAGEPSECTASAAFREVSGFKRLKALMNDAPLQFDRESKSWNTITNASADDVVVEIDMNLSKYKNCSVRVV